MSSKERVSRLPLVLVSLGIGVTAGFLLVLLLGETPRAVPDESGRSASPSTPRRAPTAPTPAPAASPALARALAAMPPPEAVAGQGAITGTVTTAAGAPVAGVHMQATPQFRAPPRPAGDGEPTIAEEVSRLVEELRFHHNGGVDAVTGAAGDYALRGLADQPYEVRAEAPGYRLQPLGDARAVSPGAEVSFLAYPLVRLRVLVEMPDGSPATHADLLVRLDGREQTLPWTPAEPELELAPGGIILRAVQGKEPPRASAKTQVLLSAAVAPAPVVLRLRPRTGIAGVLRWSSPGKRSLTVIALPHGAAAPPNPMQLGHGQAERFAQLEPGDRYQVLDLRPGRYYVSVQEGDLPLRRELVSARVQVGEGMAIQDFDLPAPDAGGGEDVTIVWVHGPDGAVLGNVEVEALEVATHEHPRPTGSGEAQADGSFKVVHAPGDGEALRGGARRTPMIQVTSSTFGVQRVTYARSPGAVVTVRFAAPALLLVTLEGLAGSGIESRVRLQLAVETAHRSERVRDDTFTRDAQGRFELAGVAPGEHVLEVQLESGGNGRMRREALLKSAITAVPGENHVTLRLPLLVELQVTSSDHWEGQGVGVTSLAEAGGLSTQRHSSLDGAGRATFTDLPAGSYRISIDGRTMPVTVAADATVAFTPTPRDALEVTIREGQSGYLADAGFRTGDRIIGVDGAAVADVIDIEAALAAAALAGERVPLTVLRAGATVVIEVDAARLAAGDRLGGYYGATTR